MEHIEYFEKLVGKIPFGRFGKTFESEKRKYFYDSGTGKVLECEDAVYIILQQLENNRPLKCDDTNLSAEEYENSLKILRDAVEKENILKAVEINTFIGDQVDCLEDTLNNNVQHLCLELTQKCNLRCRYCIYQDSNEKFRNFGQIDLDFETAKKAIDYTLEHAGKSEVHFGFYGGEPLLKYDLLKECVEYILSKEKERKIFFSMTTNGTLMTKEKAQFFASIPHFSIVFSLDGDEAVHNSNRIMMNGEGSFELAFTGFKNAQEAYGEKAIEQLLINAVVCPPYTDDKFNKMQVFYDENAKGYQIQYSYVDYGQKGDRNERKISSPVLEWTRKSQDKRQLFSWGGITQLFLQIHKRPLCDTPIQGCRFNGCCVPGSRRIYVTAQGKYKVCERVGEAPEIGNVDTGIDTEQIRKQYIDSYIEQSIKECQNCWMRNMCGVCYSHCYDKNGIDIEQKNIACDSQRFIMEEMMKLYHEILEEDPDSLQYLNDIVVK